MGLVFANVPQAQAIRRTVEVSSKIFDCADVMAYGIFRKVTTLEFFQHHFAKSGHGDGLLMTRQLISTFRQPPLHYLTRSVRRTSGFVLARYLGVAASDQKRQDSEVLLPTPRACRPWKGRCRERHCLGLPGEDVVVSVNQLELHLGLAGRQPGYVDCVVVTRIRPPPGQVVDDHVQMPDIKSI